MLYLVAGILKPGVEDQIIKLAGNSASTSRNLIARSHLPELFAARTASVKAMLPLSTPKAFEDAENIFMKALFFKTISTSASKSRNSTPRSAISIKNRANSSTSV